MKSAIIAGITGVIIGASGIGYAATSATHRTERTELVYAQDSESDGQPLDVAVNTVHIRKGTCKHGTCLAHVDGLNHLVFVRR